MDSFEFCNDYISALPTPNRIVAPFQWFGGKGNLIKKLLPHLPTGDIYVEPFCGAASMFWHTHHSIEVINDLNGDIINLFRVLQDKSTFDELLHRIVFTPYSFDEFKKAIDLIPETNLDQAWQFFIKQNFGFSCQANSHGNFGRSFYSSRGMMQRINSYHARIKNLMTFHSKLMNACIEHKDGLEIIKFWDTEKTVFYIDPPYVHSTRTSKNYYKHECVDEFHENLIQKLLTIKGSCMVSGYNHPIYQKLEDNGWQTIHFETISYTGKFKDGTTGKRTETIWIKNNNRYSAQTDLPITSMGA